MSAHYELEAISSGFFTGASRLLWVAKNGSDTTGDGTLARPFLTINRACTAIRALGNASTTIRYAVVVGPGRFTEDLVMSDWTWIVGIDTEASRVTFTTFTFGAEFDANVDHRCGLQSMTISGGGPVDFAAANSEQGKISFINVWFADSWTFTAMTNQNQVTLANCLLSGFTQNGFDYFNVMNCAGVNGANFTVNDTATLSATTYFRSSEIDGQLFVNATAGGLIYANVLWLGSSLAGFLTLNGANASIAASSSPILFPGGVILLAGAPDPRLVLSGAKAGNAALASVCTQLAASGGFVDTTT